MHSPCLKTLAPSTILGMNSGTRVMKWGVHGRCGSHVVDLTCSVSDASCWKSGSRAPKGLGPLLWTLVQNTGIPIFYHPEGPSTQYLRTLVPKTIPPMAFGIRVLRYWVLGRHTQISAGTSNPAGTRKKPRIAPILPRSKLSLLV